MSKLSALGQLPLPIQTDDEIYVIRGGQEYRVDLTAMYQGFFKSVPGFEGYIIIPAAGNIDMTIVQENDLLIGKGAFFSGEYVMMRATQDSPTLDAHFKIGYQSEEAP